MMSAERILKAAIASMIRGRHSPHCYSAHVIGKGYVNDGSAAFNRADYLRQLERDATSELENMGWAEGYAEPGYDQPKRGVLMANWNKFPRHIGDTLERAGYAIEWSDEWDTCEDCNKAVRTSPDSHGWEPSFVLREDSTLLCHNCVEAVQAQLQK